MHSIDIGRNESVQGVTILGSNIYILCQSKHFDLRNVIRVFEDRNLFRLQKKIDIREIKYPADILSSKKNENCLYVLDHLEKCFWKIVREENDEYKISKWLTTDYLPVSLSMMKNGQILLVKALSSSLIILGTEADLLETIQLPEDIKNPLHAVKTSIGNFVILHLWAENVEKYTGKQWLQTWSISEVTSDAQMVIRSFIPSNEKQIPRDPSYLALDSDDRVLVADNGNRRVFLLDSNLKWNRILCEVRADTHVRGRLCFEEKKKQLIVGKSGYADVYTLNQC